MGVQKVLPVAIVIGLGGAAGMAAAAGLGLAVTAQRFGPLGDAAVSVHHPGARGTREVKLQAEIGIQLPGAPRR